MCKTTITSGEAFTDPAAAITAAMNAAEAAGKFDQQGYPTIGDSLRDDAVEFAGRALALAEEVGRADGYEDGHAEGYNNAWTEIETVLGEENSRGLFTIVQAANDSEQCANCVGNVHVSFGH